MNESMLRVGELVHVSFLKKNLPVKRIGRPDDLGLVEVVFEDCGVRFAVGGIKREAPFKSSGVLKPALPMQEQSHAASIQCATLPHSA